ncbi:MAG: hypothetical protein PHR77_06640 [Kiritimatiellae bacterium]|nr:hypothetical protein [Kiritimatiellia bacterium]MDD5520955.1 hypothetical protein [Kiritimatiellia bacterium]
MFRISFILFLLVSSWSLADDIEVIKNEASIPPAKTQAFEFGTVPQQNTTVTLEITARMNYPALSGSSLFMEIKLNGRLVGAAKSRSVSRLLNKPLTSPVARNLPASWFDGGRWRLLYAPDFEKGRKVTCYVGDPYTYVLDVTDLTNPAAENRLEIVNTANSSFKGGGGELIIQRIVIHTKAGASPMMAAGATIEPVINTGKPSAGPAKYKGRILPGGGFILRTGKERWEFASAISYPNAGLNRLVPSDSPDKSGQPSWAVTVEKAKDGGKVIAVGPDYRISRKVRFTARRVEVTDEITNAHTDSPLGLLVRHDLDLKDKGAAEIRIAGSPDPCMDNYYAPANPSVHVAIGDVGLGIICEDTVFASQARLYCEQKPSCAGIRTEMLYLPPGGVRTLEWAIYPVASRDYYDFINLVREDRGSNFTTEGAWTFFSPDTIIATPIEKLREQFSSLGINYACYCGGWVDGKHDRKKIGFGTGVMDPYWIDFRRRLKEATAKLHEMKPGIKVLVYYDTQRDTSDGGHERFKDSWLTNEKGEQLSTEWSGQYSLTYSVVATLDNSFGKAMLGVAERYMDEMGVDGLYWDEMEGTGYGAPLITYNTPDGFSCILDPKNYTILRQVGVTTLLGEGHRMAVIDRVRAKGGTLMGNGPPCTRKLLEKKVQRMVEIQHNDYWNYQGNLDTPLGYASSRRDFGNWIRALRMATLLVGTTYTYEHEISPYVFPFTPIELHYGYLLGRERIITLHTGEYGWQNDASLMICHRFDKNGKRYAADWPTTLKDGMTRTKVSLGADEVGILVRLPCVFSKARKVIIRNVSQDGDSLNFTAEGKGKMTLRLNNVENTIILAPEPKQFSFRLK